MALQVDHEYRVVGRPLGGDEPTEYERLVYVGTMVWGVEGALTESHSKTEVFWWRAQKHHVLF